MKFVCYTRRAVSEAEEESLRAAPGMSAPAAKAVYRYFHEDADEATSAAQNNEK